MERSIAVVGAGITGLAAAHRLLAPTDNGDAALPAVTVFEGTDRVGGRIAASPFAGVAAVDEGADAFLARVPDAVDLAVEVGLDVELTHPEPVGAAVWHDGLHDIPDGLLLGVPAKLGPLARTGLLSWRGKLRAAREPFLRRTPIAEDSIGAFVRDRFGDEVHERLVDALVGSIYATDTDRFSLAEVPQLHALARDHRSLLLGARSVRGRAGTATGAAGAIFAAPRGGIAALTEATARSIVERGGQIRFGTAVNGITREPDAAGRPRWVIAGEGFDAVIVATPAPIAAITLRTVAGDAAELLARSEAADVILVSLHVAPDEWPERLAGRSGYLVPKPVQRWVTAASFGSQKWAHWQPADGGQILRVSLGRDGRPVLQLSDEEVVDHVLADLERHLGVSFSPREVRISRWRGAFAQYRPHHARWADAVDAALPEGIFVAGSSYRGIGIPACIRQARTISQRADEYLDRLPE